MDTANDTVNHDEPDTGRRTLLKMTGVGVAALGVASVAGSPALAQASAEWDKVFPKSDLAPKFYPVLSSLQRFLVAVFWAVAA
ncbi:twin-arginine translocation signal domain-containing protein [Rhizobium leguminosarum]|uniref:twin-arginine translocation signal domain-containing protein n=1 Tax=Rhizobium leguminosarum TaxID=384 RepID=UPI00234315DE|nr:twin-arginine translocation signal domain-containing protein [Rhizobium leguminosarum]